MADKSLIQFILDLLRDPQALAEFKENPQGVMGACGLANVSPEDVHDAIVLAQDNDDVSFDRDYNTGGSHGVATPPPPPHHDDHEAGIKYLDKYVTNNYVTNNYVTNNYDDRDTIIDQSVNQNIDTGGGDFDQHIENNSVNATGDGAVAAGGDIEDSNVVTGNGNVAGDGNEVVKGDDNTVAFGQGSAVSDVEVDDGAFSVDGPASVDNSTNDSFNKVHTEANETTEIHDSYNQDTDNSVDTHIEDNSHNDVLSHNDTHVGI